MTHNQDVCRENPGTTGYIRSVRRLYARLYRSNYYRQQPPHPYSQRNQYPPPKASPQVETFLQGISRRLQAIHRSTPRSNLSGDERGALRTLRYNKTIVLKNADKGSCLVIEDIANYGKEENIYLTEVSINPSWWITPLV